jgi:DNA-binding PadR family transcriptional regulator
MKHSVPRRFGLLGIGEIRGGVVRLGSEVVAPPSLSADDWAVLGAVAEGPTHGYAVAQLLASDGPLGRVWTLERNEVYNAVKRLANLDMVSEVTTEPGQLGPERTVLRITPAGRRRLRKWLAEPVDHIRDVRTLLLLKLLFLDRSDRDPAPLIEAQVTKLTPVLEGLEASRDGADGFDWVLTQWRVKSCRATLEFLARVRG